MRDGVALEYRGREMREQDKGERVRKGSWDERETTWQDMKQWRLERLRESTAGLQKLIHRYTHFTEIYTSTTLQDTLDCTIQYSFFTEMILTTEIILF